MIKSVHEYPISIIINDNDNNKYIIPKFQREYKWKKEDCENIFNDLLDNDKGYFLGSIICINQGKDAFDITPLEIIDGQQRLATISLSYAAIYNRFLKEKRNDEEFIHEKITLKNRLIIKNTKNKLKLELSYQKNNLDDYKAILEELKLYNDTKFKRPLNLGNRRIYRTYQYLKKRISELDDYDKLSDFLERLNSAMLVKIEVESHADAFILFESVNNRGIPLSAMDIIKNKLLAKLEKNELSIDDAFNKWIKLVDNLEDYSIQERFLRQYYNAFRYKEEVGIKGYTKATRSNLIKIYEKLIDSDVNSIFNELIEKSKIYNSFIIPSEKEKYAKYGKDLIDLLHIGAAPSYTLLIYLFSNHFDKEDLIHQSIKFLVKYFVRRNLTDSPGTRDLDNIFIELISECENNKDHLNFDIIKDFLQKPNRFSESDEFKNLLEGSIYETNAPVARFILSKLEEEHKTREIYVDLWEKDKNKKYLWTIEHIFPQGKNIPKDWINMIAGGDEIKAKELQKDWVHKLGNLTLTGYNSKLSNFSFEKKRDRKDKSGNHIGYRNGLYLNKELKNKDSWKINDIKVRTDLLSSEAFKMFDV
jgi:uncharacterized protein with ParB-like and HNH nuclease domain